MSRMSAWKTSSLVGVAAAIVAAILLNVLAERRFTRWDATLAKRWTLSVATRDTVRSLPEPATIWVLLAPGDPLGQGIRQLLTAYEAESQRIVVRYIDPDRDPLGFEDARRRFGIEAGRTADGRVVMDAAIVVTMGDRRWFITTQDLLEVSEEDKGRIRRHEEQALTHALRSVQGGEKVQVCFTEGHGELSIEDGSDLGAGHLRDILEKDNYAPRRVDLGHGADPLASCGVVVVAGPRSPFSPTEDERLAAWLTKGGSVLYAASPVRAPGKSTFGSDGLAASLAAFGIFADDAMVVERDPERILESEGVGFLAEARPHGITAGLVGEREKTLVPRIRVKAARPLSRVPGDVVAADLVVTGARAFAIRDVRPRPEAATGDRDGPFSIALASERPRVSPSVAHGPRLVALGSTGFLSHAAWQEPLADRGAALVTENALSWLTSRPRVVDIPERAAVPAGMRLTEASRREVRDYVVFYMPAAALLLGLAVAFRRRSTEGRSPAPR